jgi:hypothetical protein
MPSKCFQEVNLVTLGGVALQYASSNTNGVTWINNKDTQHDRHLPDLSDVSADNLFLCAQPLGCSTESVQAESRSSHPANVEVALTEYQSTGLRNYPRLMNAPSRSRLTALLTGPSPDPAKVLGLGRSVLCTEYT